MKVLFTACLILIGVSSSGLGQGAQAVRIPPSYKDGSLATVLSFMTPGMGQFYIGRGGKGFLIFGSALGGIAYSSQLRCANRSDFSGDCFEYKKNSSAGYIVAGVAYVWGLLSAASDAEEHNMRLLRIERSRVGDGDNGAAPASFMTPSAVRR